MEATARGDSFDQDLVTGVPSSAGDAGAFSRAHIRGDHPVPALDLTGAKRAVYMVIYGVVVAVALFGATLVIGGNLIVDVLYTIVDPRIRYT